MATHDSLQQPRAFSLKAPGSVRDRVAALRITMLTVTMQLVIRATLFLRACNY